MTIKESVDRVLDQFMSSDEQMTMQDILERLERLKILQSNWNYLGAKSFDVNFVQSIIEIVKELQLMPKYYPTAHNSIIFEYNLEYKGDFNTFLEIEMYKDRFITSIQNDEKEIFKKYLTNQLITVELLNDIIAGNYTGQIEVNLNDHNKN